MANKNFEVKHGLSVGGTERITAAGAGSLTNLTLSGNLTVQGTTVTLDASTLQVADKNIVLNYHASNDTSSASSGAGITIQDAVNGTTDATILWDASDDEFDFSHGINIPNLKVSGGQGTDGQLLTSTGSGVAWEDAPAGGPTFKTFGTSSIMIGDSTTGTINAADYNTGLGINVFENLTTGDKNTAVGYYSMGGKSSGNMTGTENTAIGNESLPRITSGQHNTAVGAYSGEYLSTGQGNTYVGYYAGYQNFTGSFNTAMGRTAFFFGDGSHNVAIGRRTLQSNGTKNYNTALGNYALSSVSTGEYNTGLGYEAGRYITTGSKNVVIGRYDGNENGLDIRTSSNNIVLSDGDSNIRMVINSSGNIGIGNSAPATNLHIGSGTEGQNLGVKLNRGSTTNFFIACDGTKQAYVGVDNTEGHMKMGSLSNHPVQISQANGSAIYIDTSKNVGIGTNSPASQLHVHNPSTAWGAYSILTLSSDAIATNKAELKYYRGADANTESFRIALRGSEYLTIDKDGRVGIGTTSPGTSTKGLHVVHDANEGTPSFPSGEVIIAQRNFNSSQGCHIGIIGGSASESAINFGDKDNSDAGIISYKHNGDYMSFTTNTTEHWKMLANGSFQPTQQHTKDIGGVNAEVRNIYAQGLYVGGSAAANKLDDYEEGTWTPVLQNTGGTTATHGVQVGQYTKVGNLVHVHGTITCTSGANMGGSLAIYGLPFASLSTGSTRNVGSLGAMSGCGTAAQDCRLVLDPNSSFIYIILQQGQSYNHNPGFNSAINMYGFSIVYSTA